VLTLSAAAGSPNATARTRQNLALAYGLSGDNEKAAAVGRTDLDEASVKSNLAYYTMLRGLSDHARAAAIIGARSVGPSPNASGAPEVPQAAAQPPAPTTDVADAMPASPDRSVEAAPLAAPPPSPAPAIVKTAARKPAQAPHRVTPPAAIPAVAPTEPAPAAAAEAPPAPIPAVAQTEPAPAPAQAAEAPPATPETHIETGKAEDPVAGEPAPRQEAVAAPAKPEEPAPTALPDDSAVSQIAALPPVADAPRLASSQPAPTGGVTASTPLKRRSYFVQIGAFKDAARAHKLCDGLVAKGYDLTVAPSHGDPAHDLFLCRSSEPAGRTDAAAVAQRLRDGEAAPALLVPTAEN